MSDKVKSLEEIIADSISGITDGVDTSDKDADVGVDDLDLDLEGVNSIDNVNDNDDNDDNDNDDATKEDEEEKADNSTNIFDLKKKEFLESGEWEDVIVEIDGEEKKLSEIELDETTFFDILDEQKKIKSNEISDKYIDKSKLPELAQKLNDIALAGGDITDVIKTYDKFKKPYEDLDLMNPKHQELIVANQLKQKGLDDDVIAITINKYKKDLILDKKANEIVEQVDKIFDKYLDDKKKEAEEKKAKELENKKKINERIKGFLPDIDGRLKKKIEKLSTFSNNGELPIKSKIDELLETDPEKVAEIGFMLTDYDKYIEYKTRKAVNKNNVSTLKKVILGGKKKTKIRSKQNNELDIKIKL
jgi:hypothetical protein